MNWGLFIVREKVLKKIKQRQSPALSVLPNWETEMLKLRWLLATYLVSVFLLMMRKHSNGSNWLLSAESVVLSFILDNITPIEPPI